MKINNLKDLADVVAAKTPGEWYVRLGDKYDASMQLGTLPLTRSVWLNKLIPSTNPNTDLIVDFENLICHIESTEADQNFIAAMSIYAEPLVTLAKASMDLLKIMQIDSTSRLVPEEINFVLAVHALQKLLKGFDK